MWGSFRGVQQIVNALMLRAQRATQGQLADTNGCREAYAVVRFI